MENTQIPKTGLAALRAHFKDDFISGFTVSLIALPLCIGIAIASGFPPLAGLITAIVGGMFASRIAGSFVTISGPAAGLIVISLGAIESLGGAGAETNFAGYPHALGAIVVAGCIVALFGFLKVGKVGDYFPSSVVHGMLAAIGIIIIIKQIFPALDFKPEKGEILEQAAQIPTAFQHLNPSSLIIALTALVILIVHPMIKVKAIKLIPAPMWVLLAVVPIAAQMAPDAVKFVDLPDKIFGEGGIQFPSFEKIGLAAFWIAVVSFALVSGIESLLSAKAVDSLDPYKRKANLDKDLVAMGSGSALAAAVGGLPMISEIVRSSANINNGGKTQWANFYHGTLLLVYILVLAFAIELIPTAALAAMLVFTGFRLGHPREFIHTWHVGKADFFVFVSTIIGVLATDLLIGIGIGIVVNYVLIFAKGSKFSTLFVANSTTVDNKVSFTGSLHFSNYLSIKKRIVNAIADNAAFVDFTGAELVDHTVMHHLETFRKEQKVKGIIIEFQNMSHLNPVSHHDLAERSSKVKKLSDAHPTLSRRQTDLLGMAARLNWNYNLKQDWNGGWDFYSVTVRKQILALENLVIHNHNSIVLTAADITTQEGARTTTDIQSLTALKISGMKQFPKFFMERETMVDKLNNLILGGDVNFESHPKFSANCILRGEDEVAVRSVFTTNILNFFEANPNLFLVSNGQDLLVRSDYRLLNTKEIEELMLKATELLDLLSAK